MTAQPLESATADFRLQATSIAAPVALPVPFVLQAPEAPPTPRAFQVSAPSQGPPIFLKVRSLLN